MIVPPHMPSEPSTPHPRRHHTDRIIAQVLKFIKFLNLENRENHQKHDFFDVCQKSLLLVLVASGCLEIVSDVYFSVFLILETTFIKLKIVCDRILKSDKSRKSSKT